MIAGKKFTRQQSWSALVLIVSEQFIDARQQSWSVGDIVCPDVDDAMSIENFSESENGVRPSPMSTLSAGICSWCTVIEC